MKRKPIPPELQGWSLGARAKNDPTTSQDRSAYLLFPVLVVSPTPVAILIYLMPSTHLPPVSGPSRNKTKHTARRVPALLYLFPAIVAPYSRRILHR